VRTLLGISINHWMIHSTTLIALSLVKDHLTNPRKLTY
jgi:hypothetical protein